MKIHTFICHILQKMQEEVEGEVKVSIRDITKNNGVVLTGLTFTQEDVNISPTIYLEDFYKKYQNGTGIEDILAEIKEIYYKSKLDKDIDMAFFTEYEMAKSHIVYKLIHYDKNRELLKEIPHREYLDLAIVYYYLVDMKEFSNATILIHNKHLEYWKVNEEALYNLATKNTPRLLNVHFCGMMDVLKEITEEEFWLEDVQQNKLSKSKEFLEGNAPKDATGMYVLSNVSRLYGAATILYDGILERCYEQLGGNFFILPSSVHEVILVPDSETVTREKLSQMVKEVNATQVEMQEQLSDFVYYYNAENRGIVRL